MDSLSAASYPNEGAFSNLKCIRGSDVICQQASADQSGSRTIVDGSIGRATSRGVEVKTQFQLRKSLTEYTYLGLRGYKLVV